MLNGESLFTDCHTRDGATDRFRAYARELLSGVQHRNAAALAAAVDSGDVSLRTALDDLDLLREENRAAVEHAANDFSALLDRAFPDVQP